MKTRKYSKIMTLFLALAMIMAMSITTFAGTDTLGTDNSTNPTKPGVISNGGVEQNGKDNGDGSYGVYTGLGNTVTITKEIVIFNTRATTAVYIPNITYNYTLEAASASEIGDNKYITDEYSLKGAINAGESAAIKTGSGSVVYNNTTGVTQNGTADGKNTVVTSPDGVASAGTVVFEFTPSGFNRPGVYRYKITESVDDGARAQAGIVNDGYNAVRYLDVYVQNNSDFSGYEIYGYVCFEAAANTEFDATGTVPIEAKTNGFVSEKNDKDQNSYSKSEAGVDIYQTANVKIQKNITGTMADKNHEFPFVATFTNGTVTSGAKFAYNKYAKDSTIDTSTIAQTVEMTSSGVGTVDGVKLKDGDFIYAYGVPDRVEWRDTTGSTTVMVKETNDTAEVYNVTAKYDGTDVAVSAPQVEAGADSQFSEAQIVLLTADGQDEAEITNKLNAISPTNVVMRYAPYLFILGGAMLLLFTSRRRRSEQE